MNRYLEDQTVDKPHKFGAVLPDDYLIRPTRNQIPVGLIYEARPIDEQLLFIDNHCAWVEIDPRLHF